METCAQPCTYRSGEIHHEAKATGAPPMQAAADAHLCVDMCVDMCVNMCVDMCVDVCIGMCGGMCGDTCV